MDKFSANTLPFITLSFMAGIYAGGAYPAGWPPVFLYAAAGGLIFMAGFGVYFDRLTASFKPTMALFFIIGMISWIHADYLPAGDIGRFVGESAVVEGMVDEIPQLKKIRTDTTQARYIVKAAALTAAGNKKTPVPVSGKIQVSVYYQENADSTAPVKINYGDKISVYGMIDQPRAYNNPGRRDTAADMKRQGIGAVMNVKKDDLKLLAAGGQENSWRQRLADWRLAVIDTMKAKMPDNDRGILSAMIFGDSEGISETVLKNFSITGLVHILSVSGAHITIVAGVLNWLGALLRFPAWLTGVCAVAGILLYAVISGLSAPVIRASVMGVITVLAVVFKREKDAANALSIAALVMLVYSPGLIYNISFQLSFGATLGIVYFHRPTEEYFSFLPQKARQAFSITIAAQLGCLPFMAWYFNNLSLMALLANLMVLPIIEIVLIIGLAGTAIHAFWPLAAGMTFVAASLLLGLGVELTAVLAKVPGALWYVPTIGALGGAVYYVFLFWLYGYELSGLPRPAAVFKYFAAKKWRLAAVAGLSAVVFCGWYWYPRPLAVHFLDVGQGDCTLVTTPGGKVILIDTGGAMSIDGGAAAFDIGERVVAPYLRHHGLRRVDYLILTHGHQDHAGGAAGIASNMTVNNIVLARENYSPAVKDMLRVAPGAAIIPAYTGQSFHLDGVLVSIEQAGEVFNETGDRSNEVSSVVGIRYGRHGFLITGDLGAKGEAEMLARGITPFTLLKAGHHGSRTSSGKDFLAAVAPRYAVISVGYNNRFGHPHPEVLTRMLAQNIQIYRTDEDGAVVFFSDGENMKIKTFKTNNIIMLLGQR